MYQIFIMSHVNVVLFHFISDVVSLTNSLRDPIKPGVPTTPTRLAVQNTTSSSLVLQWEPSVVLNSDGKPANKAVLGQ